MTYTQDVPQATQTIAFTQPIIQDNFQFIQADGQIEHIFNGNAPFGTQAEGTHIQTSMPNQSPEVSSLPSGTAGVYYVASSKPKFYDGTNHYFLGQSTTQQSSPSATGVTATNSYATIFTLPARCTGVFYAWNLSDPSSNFVTGQFFTGTAGTPALISENFQDHNMSAQFSGNSLQIKLSSGTLTTIAYVIQYTTV